MNDQLRFLGEDFALMTDEQVGMIWEWQGQVAKDHYSIYRTYYSLFFRDFSAISVSRPDGERQIYACCWPYNHEKIEQMLAWIVAQPGSVKLDYMHDLSAVFNHAARELGLRKGE